MPIPRATRSLAPLAAACALAAAPAAHAAPGDPHNAGSTAPAAQAPTTPVIEVSLSTIQCGSALHRRAHGHPGASPHRYIQLGWHAVGSSGHAISIVGSPRILEAVAQRADGSDWDLAAEANPSLDPWPMRPAMFSAPAEPDGLVAVGFGVAFQTQRPMPTHIRRVAVEVEVASRGEILEFGLPPRTAEHFTPICDGVEARIAAIDRRDPHQQSIIVEYRLLPASGQGDVDLHDTQDAPGASTRAPREFPRRQERTTLLSTRRTPVIAAITAIDEAGEEVGSSSRESEIPTRSGALGVVSVIAPAAAKIASIRLSISPDAQIHRYRVEASNIDLSGH